MIEISHLLSLVDEYKRREGITDKTLSFRMFGDSKKLAALRAGKSITVTRFNMALQWLSDHWPGDRDWPSGISRPHPNNEAA